MVTSSASRVEEARKLVAIVDDDASGRRSMDGLIRSFGYRTQVSASADEFLASTAPGRAACLLLDVRIPGTDGLADPGEFIAQFDAVFAGASHLEAMSRSALRTAREYTRQRVLERHLPALHRRVRRTRTRRSPRRVREKAMKALVHTGPFGPRSHR